MPRAFFSVKDSTTVPSGSVPNRARGTPGPAGAKPTTPAMATIAALAFMRSPPRPPLLLRAGGHRIIPSYHMRRALALAPAEHGYPRGGLHGQIVHDIGRRILSGEIRPGELLPTPLRASRTVLREAIKVLAAKGLVESRPKTGTRVRPPDSWNLLDPDVLAWQQEGMPQPAFLRKLTEVRFIVETAAAELAAQRARAPQLALLNAAFRDMRAALARKPADYEAFDQADI